MIDNLMLFCFTINEIRKVQLLTRVFMKQNNAPVVDILLDDIIMVGLIDVFHLKACLSRIAIIF
jgi:hypothetical protein